MLRRRGKTPPGDGGSASENVGSKMWSRSSGDWDAYFPPHRIFAGDRTADADDDADTPLFVCCVCTFFRSCSSWRARTTAHCTCSATLGI